MKTAEFGQPCRAPEPGKCRICGRGAQAHWVDETKTLCDLPDCVKAARSELTVRQDLSNLTLPELEPYGVRIDDWPR